MRVGWQDGRMAELDGLGGERIVCCQHTWYALVFLVFDFYLLSLSYPIFLPLLPVSRLISCTCTCGSARTRAIHHYISTVVVYM